jgi:hypothetical protein
MANKQVFVAFKLTFDTYGNAEVAEGIDSILGIFQSEQDAYDATLAEYKSNNLNKYSYTVKNIAEHSVVAKSKEAAEAEKEEKAAEKERKELSKAVSDALKGRTNLTMEDIQEVVNEQVAARKK